MVLLYGYCVCLCTLANLHFLALNLLISPLSQRETQIAVLW